MTRHLRTAAGVTAVSLTVSQYASFTCLECLGCSEPLSSGVPSPADPDSSARLDHDTFLVMLAMVVSGSSPLKVSLNYFINGSCCWITAVIFPDLPMIIPVTRDAL